ncbi:2,5-diketo-D-gluconic acid reductase [Companilactobacillus nuruki]|uniref:2,5-diketo-D-gluconic acid reductase n=1 Tax=Companilactobacillus nuruki TaxID=1993540 RepID=A0A2N7AVW0_9LACO|nr:2,5-diketo-D-gluconic acid reductase [Companilactobacillus nuruki]
MQTIKLNNGIEMPQVGFGVFQITDLQQCETAVVDAIASGYRLLDTAAAYQNETAVGKAIKKSGIDRKNLFVTSKLWVSDANYPKAQKAIDQTLKNLKTDYLDLYLMHQPYGDVSGAWRAMEEAYEAGKIRAIGVSNFYADQLKNLELSNDIKPVINQIEVNPWHQQKEEVEFAQSEDIAVEAWAPFAEGKHNIFTNETLASIGQKYNKTSGQVILRWLLQRGIVVIPKSVHKERMQENIDVFDFELSDSEMKSIASLDRNESQFFDHRDPVTIEQIFGSSLEQLRKR